MPKAVERKLMREGRAKGLRGKRLQAYVYGTMNKLGLLSTSKKKHHSKKKK